MKIKLLILVLISLVQLKVHGQTPADSCSASSSILQVDTEYSINNLNTSQFTYGQPIQGNSVGGNSVKGFWFRFQIPSGYYARKIEIYDVSNNFNPVVAFKSNCSFSYYPNTNSNADNYADDNGYGGSETFGTGINGPGSNNDGIYHLRIYHYDGSESPTVSFKIKITDETPSSSADLSVYSLSTDPVNAIVGENVDLETEIINLGEADVTSDVTIHYYIDGVEIDDDQINNSELPLSQNEIEQEQESNYVFTNPGTYQYCVTIDNHSQETNYSNNTLCMNIVVENDTSGCDEIIITQQPGDQSVSSGNSATFLVSANGTAPITYQWKRNGSNISGATNNIYTTSQLDLSDDGNSYQCEVTNCDGSINSNIATVTVTNSCNGVDISQNPQDQTRTIGETATFSVSTTGTTPITYQWRKNGINISGATNSNYTTPALDLSDNGDLFSCYMTNCDGNNFIVSNSAMLTISNNPPSELTIETTNSTFPNDKTLWSGNSNDSPNYIKVCADGTKSTRFIFVNNSSIMNENIGFKIVPDNSAISEYGDFLDSDININNTNNTITALYTHPTTFLNSADYNSSRSIEIYDMNNSSNILLTIPLRIYKTPVLMVHGLWGDAYGFEEMENHLFNVGYNSTLTKKVNYCMNAGNSFNENSWVVPNNIISLLDKCRMHNFSSGKVDIVSHSMGGILSRIYIQSNDYRDNVNKFITLNSPHSGSPLGNLAFNPNIGSLMSDINMILNSGYIFNCDPSLTDGAVYDLAINSDRMNEINSPSSLTNNTVPSHTVTTIKNFTSTQGYFLNSIAEILAPELNTDENDFTDNLFDGDSHDYIVSSESQRGGLTGNATQLMNEQIQHIGAQEESEVINHVRFLLQQDPSSSYFEQNGFSPASINANYRPSSIDNVAIENDNELIPNSIFINSPNENTYFNVGEDVNVNITSINGINRILFYAIDPLNDNYFKQEFQSTQVNTQYTISNDTYEKISLLALGFNDNGLVDYEIITIGVNSNITVTGIEFLNDEIHIQDDFIAPISINAIYSNGDRKLISDLSNVQLNITDVNIAEQFQSNFLKGNNLGATNLNASYLGYSISTPVIVYESNVVMPDLSTLSVSDFDIANSINDLTLYPNPNNGKFTIKLDSFSNEKAKVLIFNSIGQLVSSFFNEKTNDNGSIILDVKNLKSSLYYVKVIFKDSYKVFKMLKE
ncbi:immunoglobulin domain-containing protein [Kordia sp.]|uniref:immunoglobulin domain-containing protein n=1 Tax=Kordia sp. TaxID=1965332 RepID=UPI003D279A2E